MSSQIIILPSDKIDTTKWDNCVRSSSNSLIYAHSFYLDAMADNWDGIIVDDYKAVMPLPWRKKFGIKYLYHPAFIQQLGLFGEINKKDIPSLFATISSFVKYGDVQWNYSNQFVHQHLKTKPLTNFIIDLSKDYEGIKNNYSKDIHYLIKKAEKENYIYTSGNKIEFCIELYKTYYAERMPQTTNKDYSNFTQLCLQLKKNNNCLVRKITTADNVLLAASLLLKDEHRLYNIINVVTEAGRKTEANRFLFDNIFKEFANQNLLFDFEGSNLPGVKKFYEKFGALDQPYYHWQFNNLPSLIKLIKK
jgi:hypothetical protein